MIDLSMIKMIGEIPADAKPADTASTEIRFERSVICSVELIDTIDRIPN